jgi:diguanylate cyclase (GGDEF)-like protein
MEEKRHDYWTKWIENKSPEEIAKMLADIEYESEHDGLTGLLNRKGWNRQLSNFEVLSDREGKELSFLIIDINDFKRINDSFGHNVGDEVLQFVSRIFKSVDRSSDIQARIGGDEFAILLPFTNFEEAEKLKDRIIHKMTEEIDELPDNNNLVKVNPSVSIGTGTRKPYGDSTIAIKQADDNMYTIKRNK